jgi:hypothetical protein
VAAARSTRRSFEKAAPRCRILPTRGRESAEIPSIPTPRGTCESMNLIYSHFQDGRPDRGCIEDLVEAVRHGSRIRVVVEDGAALDLGVVRLLMSRESVVVAGASHSEPRLSDWVLLEPSLAAENSASTVQRVVSTTGKMRELPEGPLREAAMKWYVD